MKHFMLLVMLSTFFGSINIIGQTSTSYDANTLNISATNTVAIGVGAGDVGVGNTFLGHHSGHNSPSTINDNVLVGAFAGSSPALTASFTRNVVVGFRSLQNTDRAVGNVAMGNLAGASAVNATNNFFLGQNSGAFSNDLYQNVAIGASAGYSLDDCERNIFIGNNAGSGGTPNFKRSKLDDNIFIGEGSGQGSGTDVIDNICIGAKTGSSLNDASKNVFIGKFAGQTCYGDGNVLIGNEAGRSASGTLNNNLIIHNTNNLTTPLIFGDFVSTKLGIGTNQLINTLGGIDLTSYSLYVEGGIISDEVRVRTDWADYVFDSEYDLQSLDEVKDFITKNKHLPNMPTEAEVKAQGIEIGDLTKLQQEKIEELTLYIIEQDDKLNKLESMLLELKAEINK